MDGGDLLFGEKINFYGIGEFIKRNEVRWRMREFRGYPPKMVLAALIAGVFTICVQVKTPVSAMLGALTVKEPVALRMGTVKVNVPVWSVLPEVR